MNYLIVLERTIVFYILITVLYRFMGKREIGQLGIVDLIVSILIAELAAISIDNINESIFLSIIPIVALTLLQIGLAFYSLKNSKTRNTLDGIPSVIINKGKLNFKEMVKQRYNIDDLLTQLREKEIKSIEEVDYAVLETSGKLSVFTKDNEKNPDYPFPLILDGEIQKETLVDLNKNDEWLNKILLRKNIEIKDVFYAFYRNNELYIINKNDLN